MSDTAAHRTLQYSSPAHQSGTAIAGMWLFLGTEVLFFGALFLAFAFCRLQHPAAFAQAARQTDLAIGAINTALLLTSSAALAAALVCVERRRRTASLWLIAATIALGLAFLGLKGFEWREDFARHLFPGLGFALTAGPDAPATELFFAFYFVATGAHGVHMLVGLGLLVWLWLRARAGDLADGWATPVEVVGLYWSFVDMVWLILFPLIYLMGRAA